MLAFLRGDRKPSVAVLGDVMLDRYVQGSVRRISPEAPVPVLSIEREFCNPGGAGHVAASLAALGCKVALVGICGPDEAGRDLRQRLQAAGVEHLALVERPGLRTITKTRVVADGYHQLVRLDQDGCPAAFGQAVPELERAALALVPGHDAVVLADYDKGTLPEALVRRVIQACGKHGKLCIVDPKKPSFACYRGATLLTPNLHEAERALGFALSTADAVGPAARYLRAGLNLTSMLITRGPEGMTLASGHGVRHFAAEVREVADVSGAGDTVVATLAACLASRWPIQAACRLASVAAGIAVSKPGTYVVSAAELGRAWEHGSPKGADPETARVRGACRRRRRVVLANRCPPT